MQQTKALKLLLSLLAMLCLLLSTAAAEGIWEPENYKTLTPAPASRIVCELPKGMVADVTITDGAINMKIDTEKTDWETVLAYGYQAAAGQVYFGHGIKLPNGASMQRCMGYSVDPGNTEDQLISRLQNDFRLFGANPGDAHQSFYFARYVESSGLLQPLDHSDGYRHGTVALWYDSDGNWLGGEYFLTTIHFTSTNAITARLAKTPASSIIPLFNASAQDAALTSVRKEDGFVRYEVRQNDQLERYNISTAIAAPQMDGKDTSGWTCHYKFPYSSDVFPCEMHNAGEFGLSTRSAVIDRPLFNYDSTQQDTFTLEWHDEQGNTQYISQLSISTVCGAPAPWLAYVPSWQPVPKDRLDLFYVDPIEPGTKLTYSQETGIAHMHVDPEKLPESADYGNARYFFVFTAPEGATAYSRAGGNTDNGYGEHSYLYESTLDRLNTSRREPYSVDEDGSSMFDQSVRLFDTYHQDGSNLTVFMANTMPGEFVTDYTVINWYRDINDKDPMLTEYVIHKMDDCILQHVTTPLESEEDLPEKVTVPAIVIPNSNSAKEMQFVAELYPQESENARYYELHLLDKNGKIARLPAKAKIFLPYPEGTSFEDVHILFSLRHLNSAHQTIEEFSEEKGTLYRTKEGLWFEPSSLSPFILSWSGGVHTHKLEYSDDPDAPGSIIQYCRTCDHFANAKLLIADKHADSLPVDAQIVYSSSWIDTPDLAVVYATLDENGNVAEMSDIAPTQPGNYSAFLEGQNFSSAEVYFAILPAQPVALPTTGDHSAPLALLLLAAVSSVSLLCLRRRSA